MTERKRHRRRRGRRKKGNWFTRLTTGKKIAVCVGGILLLFAATGACYVAAMFGKLDTEDIPAEDIIVNKEAEATGEGYTNVALFGIDSREGEMEIGTRSDCIIVASLNNATKEVRMVSVYRDTILDIKDGELQKCNAAYSFGGPKMAINMLNKNLDLDIKDYATVDFAAIANAIDLLGGIEINVKEEELPALNKYVRETARVAKKEAHEVSKAGTQKLDGVQATTYARIRSTAGGDFTRTERQRLVIEKLAEKARKADLATLNKMIDELLPTIKTSFSATEILSYAADAMKYKIGKTAGFPFDKTTDTISGLGSIVIPVNLDSNVKRLHKFLYDKKGYSPSSEVKTISDLIIGRVGQRDAVDDSTLSSQTYTVAPEDKAQEDNDYSGNGWSPDDGDGNNAAGGNEGGTAPRPSNPGGDNNPEGDNNPGGTDPGPSNPGGDNTGGDNTGGTDPGGTDPGPSNPGGDNTGGTDPGGTDPGGTDPGGTDPGGTDPGGTTPETGNSSSAE